MTNASATQTTMQTVPRMAPKAIIHINAVVPDISVLPRAEALHRVPFWIGISIAITPLPFEENRAKFSIQPFSISGAVHLCTHPYPFRGLYIWVVVPYVGVILLKFLNFVRVKAGVKSMGIQGGLSKSDNNETLSFLA